MLRTLSWVLLAVIIGGLIAGAALFDAAAIAIGALTLAVAFATLYRVFPSPSRVLVMRQDELGVSDLIFYLSDEGEGRVPRDYLLQLHVAVANVGGHKAVVSTVEIDRFIDGRGEPTSLPGAPERLRAAEYRFTTGWRDGREYYESVQVDGPRLLEPGDVLTLRFRSRRGVDWSGTWDLASLSGALRKFVHVT